MAVNRNARDELRFMLRRVTFPNAPEAIEQFCHVLPEQLRETDSICRPRFDLMMILTPWAPGTAAMLEKRLATLFAHAWRESGRQEAVPALAAEELVLVKPEDHADFRKRAMEWLDSA